VVNAPRGFDGRDVLRRRGIAALVKVSGRGKTGIVRKDGSGGRRANAGCQRCGSFQPRLHSCLTLDAVLPEGRDFINLMPLGGWPSVSAEYFRVMTIPLRAGRFFRDEGEAERVAVVSESVARVLWPGENPVESASASLSPKIPRRIGA
jgi:hypothetical protein